MIVKTRILPRYLRKIHDACCAFCNADENNECGIQNNESVYGECVLCYVY